MTEYWRAGFRAIHQTWSMPLADPVPEKLPLIRVPVLLVRGGRDPLVPQAWMEQATRLIPGARLKVLPDAAHAVNYNPPDVLAAEVLEFFEELPGLQLIFRVREVPSGPGAARTEFSCLAGSKRGIVPS